MVADVGVLTEMAVVGVTGGSLTILAEALRGWLMLVLEIYALLVLRRIHRGVLVGFEFGTGKLEQTCNLAIAGGMLGGALWIAWGAVGLVVRGHSDAAPLGLAVAACVGAINTFINFVAWDAVRRAAGTQRSVIMQAQIQSRLTKLVSSLIVQLTMTLAALAIDPVVAAWADGSGALFVSAYMAVTALRMSLAGLPELLDRTVDETAHLGILRALARHYDSYERLDAIRARRSGSVAIVEIGLGFDADLPLAEVDRRAAAIKASIAGEIEGADISILVSGHPGTTAAR